jgi:hypothetical protein
MSESSTSKLENIKRKDPEMARRIKKKNKTKRTSTKTNA